MQIILGSTGKVEFVEIIKKYNFSRMITPASKFKPFDGEKYGLDNGAFYCWKNEKAFDSETFLKTVDYATKFQAPYLAVLPDIVAGGNKSLDFSLSWLGKLPSWSWYLAVQDGIDPALVIENIHLFAGLFLGGSDEFKKTANYWRKIAHIHKKKFHYGRAGIYRKIQNAYDVGADSFDSAFPLWTKKRFKEFLSWIEKKPWKTRLFSLNELHPEY